MNKCIVAISHSNYLYRNAGTEKCMREISNILRGVGIHYLQIFSFEDNSRLNLLCNMTNKVGVNLDDKFIGIFRYDSLPQVMKRLEYTDNLEYIGVHIHNLLNHNYDMLLNFLNLIDLPVILWLHDYTSVCPESPILLKNRVECCKNFVRSRDVCQNCCYYEKAKISQKKIRDFYFCIDDKIETIIAPSDNVKQNILISYPNWDNRIQIRGHLKLWNMRNSKKMSVPLRIAYAGGAFEHKGISEWTRILEIFQDNPNYEFYYLGMSNLTTLKVKNVFVNSSVQGDKAMSVAAINNKIDVAFLWSKCQETYSYTYYEMRCSGARILTYFDSGNIAQCVKKEKSGLIFNDVEELINLMRNPIEFRMLLEACDGGYCTNYETNDEIALLVPCGKCNLPHNISVSRIHRYWLLSNIHQCCNMIKSFRERKRVDANKNN